MHNLELKEINHKEECWFKEVEKVG